jgi:hypothetical protein
MGILLIFTSNNSKAQDTNPLEINLSSIALIDQLDDQFYKAAQLFINFKDRMAAEEIKKAAYFLSIQAYSVQPMYKDQFMSLEKR